MRKIAGMCKERQNNGKDASIRRITRMVALARMVVPMLPCPFY